MNGACSISSEKLYFSKERKEKLSTPEGKVCRVLNHFLTSVEIKTENKQENAIGLRFQKLKIASAEERIFLLNYKNQQGIYSSHMFVIQN